MKEAIVVMQKEIKEILKRKVQLIIGIFFPVYFGFMMAPLIKKVDPALVSFMFNNLIFYLVLMLGLFESFIYMGEVFLREKASGSIETLLCTPLSLKKIWLGKVLAVVLVGYIFALLGGGVIFVFANQFSEMNLSLTPPLFAHIFLVVPLFMTAIVGLIGFAQFLLGMKEFRILNFIIFFVFFFGLSFTRNVIGGGFAVTWITVSVFGTIAIILVLLTGYFTKFLSKERIVTTIP